MTRTDIINTFISKRNYNTYLEIGVGNGDNFDQVRCNKKTGVDPSDEYKDEIYRISSDKFFELNKNELHQTFDIIFIDGLHVSGQVKRDIQNSLDVLNENGVIVLHDCNPLTEGHQIVPQQQVEWNGDVWKAILYYRINLDGYEIFTVDIDFGCGIIQKGKSQYSSKFVANNIDEINYQYFASNRVKILNLISWKQFLKKL